MMLRILRDKFVRIGRDDDGMAMVVTLAVFMFMWLVCMGVYAIGTAVKTRIHLQNACDAAAYSAAVVQADTLSRIATINRAMSWTYIQMTRRQMDYIVYKWLEYACDLYDQDHREAEDMWNRSSNRCPLDPAHLGLGHIIPGIGWFIGDGIHETINLNDTHHPLEAYVKGQLEIFNSAWMNAPVNQRKSFYAFDVGHIDFGNLGAQIETDKNTIEFMNSALCQLGRGLPAKVEMTVNEVFEANIPLEIKDRCDLPQIFQSRYPFKFDSEEDGYLDYLVRIGDSNQELRFLRYANDSFSSLFDVFDKGIDTWFVRSSSDTGFMRTYEQKSRVLVAKWNWWSYAWDCEFIAHPYGGGDWIHPYHEHGSNNRRIEAEDCRDSRYDGVVAEPVALTSDYFSKNGTITVGVAVENQNPWTPILGTAIKGIFSAFNIGGDVMPLYMVCFASAKAGYKETLNWGNTRGVETDDRKYRVDWQNEEDWNLRQSDWDAVLIPVRRAESPAVNGSWGDGNVDFLDSYARQIGVHSTNMRAGGTKEMTLAQWRDGNGRNLPPDYYRFGRVGGRGGWRELPDGGTWDWESGAVNTEWQIEKKSQPIDFNNLQRVMFH